MYNNERFQLDGRMDLEITFQDTTICITVYTKMDTQEELLISEGVCSQLGLVTYHREVALPMYRVWSRPSWCRCQSCQFSL